VKSSQVLDGHWHVMMEICFLNLDMVSKIIIHSTSASGDCDWKS